MKGDSAVVAVGPRTWEFVHRVTVSCARPDAEPWGAPNRFDGYVERAGGILVRDGKCRLVGSSRVEWSGEVTFTRMHAPFSQHRAPEAEALDFGSSCLRFALASIWRRERDQNLPGRVEAKVRLLRVTEGRYERRA